MIRSRDANAAEVFDQARSDYAAARDNRYRKRRWGLAPAGAGADFHYRSEFDYLRLMESARDMDRNDAAIGQGIDRAVDNTVQGGFTNHPDTGSKELDKALADDWEEWSTTPELCDLAQEKTFAQICSLDLRAHFVDGDIVELFNESGALESAEGHRLRTPSNTRKNVVHGVLMEPDTRKRLEYWLTKDNVSPMAAVRLVGDMVPFPVRDEEGDRLLAHVYHPKRVTQTRGVTALSPIFDVASQFEDLNFAKLLQAQACSAFGLISEFDASLPGKPPAAPLGSQWNETLNDGTQRKFQQIGPALHYRAARGEKVSAFSGQIPNPEFFPHVKLILTLVGLNIGLPLVLMLLDASETNFSGYRGALDQARMGFRRNQWMLVRRLCVPVYRWRVRRLLAASEALRLLANAVGCRPFRHRWGVPGWPYIEPMKDATSDVVRLRSTLISPRRRAAERDLDWPTIVAETVEDNGLAIESALKRANKLNRRYKDAGITWRDLVSLPTAEGVTVKMNLAGETNAND